MRQVFILALLLFLFLPHSVYANGAGLPPFFKVNGKYSKSNPLQLYGITAQSFLLPQDFAPENYVVNQPITFEIDQSQLETAIPPDLLKNTTYIWDYGGGSIKESGLTHTHTYTKIGSYILILTINLSTDPNQQPTQFIHSYLLNILPSKDYQGLPQAVIKLNGQEVNGSLSSNAVDLNYKNPITFDASSSKSTSPITQYLWNFGDGQTGTKSVMQHKYNRNGQPAYDYDVVVLRVKDKNGFISDAFVGLNNDPNIANNTVVVKQNSSSDNFKDILIALVIVALLVVIVFLLKKRKKKS